MSKYLITFDMDTLCLKNNYHGNNYNNAYYDIGNILSKHGFERIQGSVYLGREGISEAHGTLAIQELTAVFDWFHPCVSNIKFYRLESDLDAQFIADGVFKAKQAFVKRLAELKKTLLEAGLSQDKIDAILKKEVFELDRLTIDNESTSP